MSFSVEMYRFSTFVLSVICVALSLAGGVWSVDDRPFYYGPTGKWRGDKVKQKKSKWASTNEELAKAEALGDCWLYCSEGKNAIPTYYLVGNIIAKSKEEYICQCYDKRNKNTQLSHCTEAGGPCTGGDVKDYGLDGAYSTFFCRPGILGFPCEKTT